MIRLLFLLICLISVSYAENNNALTGNFSHEECMACHQSTNAQLVTDWQQSAHAIKQPNALCTSCHGNDHTTAASRSRRNDSCVDCHGGTTASVVHSYSTSKHGVIMQLEQKNYDWSQPLREANYRAPGCAYCHMYDGNHLTGKTEKLMPSSMEMDRMTSTCLDCHSARYITQLNDNAFRMIDIARMKVREANQLVNENREAANNLLTGYIKQTEKHLINVYLGAFHQSPDYQWWHGQPALDGDLLRIRSVLDNPYPTPISQSGVRSK